MNIQNFRNIIHLHFYRTVPFLSKIVTVIEPNHKNPIMNYIFQSWKTNKTCLMETYIFYFNFR